MSGFFKGYRDCKKFEFEITGKSDVYRILKYFQNKDYVSIPKDLLITAK